jgi:3-carboxy-cis,cis-muconate cycloisomerase
VLSEAVMMALAEKIGRDRAHALVLEISRDALARKVPFRKAVAAHPEVKRRLSPRRLAAALEYRGSLGLSGAFVDRVVAAHQAERRRRRRPRH